MKIDLLNFLQLKKQANVLMDPKILNPVQPSRY